MCGTLPPHADTGQCGPCRYDGTVRGAGGNIVQFLYGEDGMDATCIEEQTLDFLRMKERDFKVPPAARTHPPQSGTELEEKDPFERRLG